jgi:hypothetical protein
METPVIYFYSDRERTANVTIEFPEGTVTEWYPGVTDFGPKFSKDFFQTEKRSFIEWDGLRILPLRQNENLDRTLPVGQPDSHYFAARGTGSDFVQMNSGTDAARQAEREKFLFYRGLGSFPSPLHVAVDSENALTLRNTTGETLKHLFVLSVREGQGHFTELNNLSPEENRNVPLHSEHSAVSSAELVNQLGYAVKQALVDEGLYVQEANAMVETWKNSWFSESGVRVLYTIPSTWTDRVLPLRVEPSPKQIARAFVGRAEVITPALEWELLQQIVRFGDKDPTARSRAVSEAQRLGLGRFAGAAIQRVLGKQPSDAFRKQAKEFQAALDPNSPAGTLARK